jgi:hypothetical protein
VARRDLLRDHRGWLGRVRGAGSGEPARGVLIVVEAAPAVGFTAETWNEEPAADVDPIVLPWDAARRDVGYTVSGATLSRRDLPAPRRR